MRATPLRLVAALVLLGTASAAQASSTQPSSMTPLSVSMYCEYGYCEATASGGSGSYTFAWVNATKLSQDWGPISSAEPMCPTSSVSVTVTDSNNSTVTAKRWYVYC